MKAVPASRYLVFVLVAGLGCLIDLATKHCAFARLGPPGGDIWWLVEGYVGVETSLNQGALFGLGQGAVALFAALSVVAAVAIVYWLFMAGAAADRLLNLALAAIMGGVLGNLYDRLGLWRLPAGPDEPIYAVRDWIRLSYHGWVWPNFNVADSLLVCGAALLFWHAFFGGSQSAATGHSQETASPPGGP